MDKNKKIKEVNVSTDIDTYKKHKYDIDNQIGDEGTLELTSEAEMNEALKLPVGDVLRSLGINLADKTPDVQQGIVAILKNMIGQLNAKYNVGPIVGENDDKGEFFDPDLYDPDEERMERMMDEDFDSLMEELNSNGSPSVDISESINPRIKKRDLIEYFKNKKDVKR